MTTVLKAFLLAIFVTVASSSVFAADDRMAVRVLGKDTAPIKVDEFVSLTCSHCAEFYDKTLPELEKRYVDTGKVRFVMHDFPLDGLSLKAAAVARCMPADEYFPFVKTLFKTQAFWAFGSGNPVDNMIQTAKLGGLAEEKARSCANDTALQNAIAAERAEATTKFQVEATPTFVINDGADVVKGAESVENFSKIFDRLLAGKK